MTRTALIWLCAATALIAVALHANHPKGAQVRLKGTGAELSFTVETVSGTRPGDSGEMLGAGTQLQLSYDAGDYTHMAVLGIDGAGQVTVHYPEDQERMALAPSGSHGPLPLSLTLTNSAGPERFVAVFARGGAKVDELIKAAQAMDERGVLPIPVDMVQSSFVVRKR